jgi:hypothetical protein
MGGGPSQQTLNTQSGISTQQQSIANQAEQASLQNQAQMTALQQPLIAQQTALASGDRNAALTASMPSISQISGGYNAAKEQIMSNILPGPAQTAALANLETQKDTTIGNAQASAVQQAPGILANIGSGLGAFSIQQLGASLSGLSGAASTNQSVLQSQTQQQAAKLGLLGSLAGTAGSVATGGFNLGGGSGGGSFTPYSQGSPFNSAQLFPGGYSLPTPPAVTYNPNIIYNPFEGGAGTGGGMT